MQPWELLAILLAGAVGVSTLSRASAQAATAAAPAALSADDAALLNRAVSVAITKETDQNVLSTFSSLLRGAGFATYADAVDARSRFVGRVLTVHAPLKITKVV